MNSPTALKVFPIACTMASSMKSSSSSIPLLLFFAGTKLSSSRSSESISYYRYRISSIAGTRDVRGTAAETHIVKSSSALRPLAPPRGRRSTPTSRSFRSPCRRWARFRLRSRCTGRRRSRRGRLGSRRCLGGTPARPTDGSLNTMFL